MIPLPRSLAPWAAELALFPHDIALALGATVSRIARLLGSSQSARSPAGEPDGYDGIERRGTYDRLLPAEWLMLDEVPEEFLRRVVAKEHAFFQRAHVQGAAGRQCLVLFDAGIDQLGGPRIAQLAMLVLFARRAAEQKADFEWGILQDADLTLRSGVTTSTVTDLLRARSARSVSSADLDRWAAFLDGLRRAETWVVGADHLEGAAGKLSASLVLVSDVLDRGSLQQVRVRVRTSPAERVKEAVVDLPSDRVAVQLLRDPFGTAAATPLVARTAVDVRSTMVFVPDTRRLCVRGEGSTLITFNVPNSPNATPGDPVVFAPPQEHSIVAVGRSPLQKKMLVLTQRETALFVHVLSKRGAMANHSLRFGPWDHGSVASADGGVLHRLGALKGDRFYVVDAKGQLIQLEDGHVTVSQLARGDSTAEGTYPAIGSTILRNAFAWASVRSAIPRVTWTTTNPLGQPGVHSVTLPNDLPPIHGDHAFYFGRGLGDSFAYATSPSTWVLVSQGRCVSMLVPERRVIHGVAEARHDGSAAGLVALDETATRLELLLPHQTKHLVTIGAPITAVEVSATGAEIAFLTVEGEVGVYSCTADAVVLRGTGGIVP